MNLEQVKSTIDEIEAYDFNPLFYHFCTVLRRDMTSSGSATPKTDYEFVLSLGVKGKGNDGPTLDVEVIEVPSALSLRRLELRMEMEASEGLRYTFKDEKGVYFQFPNKEAKPS